MYLKMLLLEFQISFIQLYHWFATQKNYRRWENLKATHWRQIVRFLSIINVCCKNTLCDEKKVKNASTSLVSLTEYVGNISWLDGNENETDI